MTPENSEQYQLNRSLVWSGFKQLAPISMFVIAFGLAFGLAAKQAGLTDLTIVTMSALVFTGAAQFAVLDLWGEQIPVITMIFTVFAINSRHLLMGATLYPWVKNLPPAKRYGLMMLASDANWAMAMQAFTAGKPGLGLLFGGGLALWSFWVIGSWLGIYIGGFLSDPKGIGLDVVMGCFLLAILLGGEKNLRMVVIWTIAGVSSLMAYWYLPENSHVIVGALAGGFAGLCLKEVKS